uniref:Uncharacterized protein n=1 Tax=Neogobius melanostomus TaxID=47308 RepID=A0A8C6UCP3_9GOBI
MQYFTDDLSPYLHSHGNVAHVNKPAGMGRHKTKRKIGHNSLKLDRAPSVDDKRRGSESLDDFVNRTVRTLKVDAQDMSPLHMACLKGDLSSLQILLESREFWVNSNDEAQGWRPLHMLLKFPRSPRALPCFQYLLRQGADINLTTESGQTPLHIAVAEGLMDFTQILVEAGADIFAKDHSGFLPLDMARISSCREIGSYLKHCMWCHQKNEELKARKQTQTLYCDLMECDKQEKIEMKPKIEETVAEWADKKGLTLKEFCPHVLASRFHTQCHISNDSKSPSGKAQKTERKCSSQPEEGPQEDNSVGSKSPPWQDEEDKNRKPCLKSKLKPWAIYTGPEPDSPLVEPDLRGKVKVWKDARTTKPHYKSRWDRKPQEAPKLPVATIQRVLFPRDYPPGSRHWNTSSPET